VTRRPLRDSGKAARLPAEPVEQRTGSGRMASPYPLGTLASLIGPERLRCEAFLLQTIEKLLAS